MRYKIGSFTSVATCIRKEKSYLFTFGFFPYFLNEEGELHIYKNVLLETSFGKFLLINSIIGFVKAKGIQVHEKKTKKLVQNIPGC